MTDTGIKVSFFFGGGGVFNGLTLCGRDTILQDHRLGGCRRGYIIFHIITFPYTLFLSVFIISFPALAMGWEGH